MHLNYWSEKARPLYNKFVHVVIESWKCDLEKLKDSLGSLTQVSEELKIFQNSINRFSREIKVAEDETRKLTGSLHNITDNTNVLQTVQGEANSAMSKFAKNVLQTDTVLDDFIKLVQIKINNLKND
jgi:hypothetical protein